MRNSLREKTSQETGASMGSYLARQQRAASTVTRISWDDFQKMGVDHRKPRFRNRKAPAWVFDDGCVRKVIAAHVAQLVGARIPEDLASLNVLNRQVLELLSKSTSPATRQLAKAAVRIGLPAYYATLIYRTYRVGCDSVELAYDLHIQPVTVRQTLSRLKATAKRIFSN
jgi:hypothetical protein